MSRLLRAFRSCAVIVLSISVATVAVAQQPPRLAAAVADEFRSQGETQLKLDPQGYRSAITSVAFSADDRWLAAAGEKEVRIWDVKTGQLLHTIRGDQMRTSYGNVFSVAFSPDGRELVVGIDDYSDAGSIRVYDLQNLGEIKQLLAGHGVPVRHVAFSRDGAFLCSAGENGKIFVWDWKQHKHIKTIEPLDPKRPIYDALMFPGKEPVLFAMGHPGLGFQGAILYSIPDGRTLGPSDKMPDGIRQWIGNFLQGGIQYPAGWDKLLPQTWHLPVDRNVWMGAGRSILRGQASYWVSVWRNNTLQPAVHYKGHPWTLSAVTLSRSGDLAASGDHLGEVHIWNPQTGQQIHRLRSLGHQYFRAAISQDSGHLYLSTTNFTGRDFKRNHYGAMNFAFDLRKRALAPIDNPSQIDAPTEQLSAGDFSFSVIQEKDLEFLASKLSGRDLARYQLRSGRTPSCFTVLSQHDLGIPHAVAFGDGLGSVVVWDARTDELRREYLGHDGFVSSILPSSDGKLLVSASTDRTVRIWGLGAYKPTGKFDFDYQSDVVIKVKPGTSSARAGVQIDDRVLTLDGKSITEITNLMLLGKFNYRPGQTIPVQMSRKGKPYSFQMTLIEGPDFAEPVLSAFVTREGEWILWTPQGYFDASPGADRFIGWHVNRGPDKSAEFFTVQQFRKQLYRPDIIDKIIETGDVAVSIRDANAESPRQHVVVDLRKPAELEQNKPPQVTILEPKLGTETTAEQISVRAKIEPQNDRPVQQVTILLDGNPIKVLDPKSAGVYELDEKITLTPGLHDIQVIASNGPATGHSKRTTASYRPAKTAEGTAAALRPDLYVLAIGISEFQNNGKGIDNLSYAAADAEAFVEVIGKHRESASRKHSLYRNIETKLLLNGEATRGGILDGFEWLSKSVRQGDIAMVFVSSHGIQDNKQNFYLAGHDVDTEKLRSTGVSWEEITKILHEEFPACKRLLFLDTCHAGGVTGAKGVFNPLHDLTAPEVGTIVFASSTPREVSLEKPDWKHGAFTKAILDMVGDKQSDVIPLPGGDELLETTEIALQLADRVKTLTGGTQHPSVHTPSNIRSFPLLYLLANK